MAVAHPCARLIRLLILGAAPVVTLACTPSAQDVAPIASALAESAARSDLGLSAPNVQPRLASSSASTTVPPATVPPANTPGNLTATVATAAASSSTTAPFVAASVSFAFSGDILPHSPLWRGAQRIAAERGIAGYDFSPMLAGLAALHGSVDVAVCHLETPIAPLGEELSTVPYYGVPAEVIDAIALAGFDRCSTASNHVFDRGAAGIDRTVVEFERVGVAQTGMARIPSEIEPTIFEVDDVQLAHMSYTFSYNGVRPPSGEEWRSRLIDVDRIVSDATTARSLGAESVVVSLHWGDEKVTTPTTEQRSIAEALTASGQVDLIVGHHAHVVQPIEQINGVWVVYGLGNILSNLPASEEFPVNSQDAMVVTIEARRDTSGEITWARPIVHPTWVDKADEWTVVLLDEELARNDISEHRRSVLEASRQRTLAVVGAYALSGALSDGIEPSGSDSSVPPPSSNA